MSHTAPYRLIGMLLATAALATGLPAEEESLHERIDKLVVAKAGGPLADRTSNAEFLRRVYLDLAGRIPSVDEARAFLKDAATDKRAQSIDRLLAGDEYPRRMSEAFHVMLMERLGNHEEWTKFLQASFAANKPWHQLVREIASPNSGDEATRGSAFFITKRLEKYGQNPTDYPGLVRDVGRLFLGVDVQCAQCHDHLFVEDYKQVDYQGLFAFLGPTFIRRDVTFPAVGENLVTKKVDFKSVFVMKELLTGPRLPGGKEVEIPTFPKGEEYATPPDKKTRAPGVPKFSPLRVLADQLPEQPAFRRNIANRLWWIMMGRGLVDPLDLHHSDNPPSHPELLELLGDELAAHDYDMRWFLRELALSETYQRSTALDDDPDNIDPATYRVAFERPLSAEQLLASMLQATGKAAHATNSPTGEQADELRKRFAGAFANPPREPEVDHSPTVKAALFLLNDEVVLSWLKPQSSNLAERLIKLDHMDQFAEELYLSVLNRQPCKEELQEVADYLQAQAANREQAVGNLIWGLLASTEFCVNH
jgi:hypothetical protein